jgi:hypothetical protein
MEGVRACGAGASTATPNRGTPRALPVHIGHNAHSNVNFADAEGGGDCDTEGFASPRSSSAAATASPLEGNRRPKGPRSASSCADALAESSRRCTKMEHSTGTGVESALDAVPL